MTVASPADSPRPSLWSRTRQLSPWGPWVVQPTPPPRRKPSVKAGDCGDDDDDEEEEAEVVPYDEAQPPDLWKLGLLDPRSRRLLAWRAFMAAAALYCVIIIPWDAGFCFDAGQRACTGPNKLDNCYPSMLASLDTALDFLFWVDVAIRLRTVIPRPGRSVVTNWRKVYDAYAKKWLLIDLVSVFPFDAAVAARAAAAGAAPSISALKLAKAPRLLRARFLFAGDETAHSGPMGRLLYLLAGFLLMSHWGACAMWALSRYAVEQGGDCGVSATTGLVPMALDDHRLRFNVSYGAAADAAQAALVLPPNTEWSLYCADLQTKYIGMAYFALTTIITIGYGDLVPGTNAERYLGVFFELAGCVACAVVFGNMAVLLQEFDRPGARLRARLEKLEALCVHYGVPGSLAARARANVAEQFRSHAGVDMDAALDAIPDNRHDDVLMHLRGGCFAAAPLFSAAPPGLVKLLVAKLKPHCFCDGDAVVKEGEAGAEMYFVQRGALSVTRRGARLAILKPGDTFGELELFAFGRRAATVAPLGGAAHVLALSRNDLRDALSSYPEEVAPLRRRAEARYRAMREQWSKPKKAPLPSPEEVEVDTTDDADAVDVQPEAAGDGEGDGGGNGGGGGELDDDACAPLEIDDDAAAAGLAHRLWGLRATAAAQQRVAAARMAEAEAEARRLNIELDAICAANGIVV